MELLNDIELNSDSILELLLKVKDDDFPESLNYFKKDECLDTLDEEMLKLKLKKSFGLNLDNLSKMLDCQLNHERLVKVTHICISLANKQIQGKGNRKREHDVSDTDNKTDGKKQKSSVSIHLVSLLISSTYSVFSFWYSASF